MGLTRRTPIRSKGRPRFKNGRDPDYLERVRGLPCWGCGLLGRDQRYRTEAAHVKSRGAGGPDRRNTLPLCTACHRLQHTVGWNDWTARYGVTVEQVKAEAQRLADDYEEGV